MNEYGNETLRIELSNVACLCSCISYCRYIFYISLSNCIEENGSTYRCASLSVDFSFVVLQEKTVAANHIIFILFLAKVYSVKVYKNFNFKKCNINKMAQLMLRQTC